jgi:uncharacterized protein YyaL (SSP411 family)
MSYDNSELLKNYVHAWQATGIEFFAEVARDIIRWMDSWLSDREHGGFFASQDADISLDDDGDYFTWTPAEAQAVLSPEEFEVATLHYDLNEIGEMHHNPSKNVLHQRASVEEIARRLAHSPEQVAGRLRSAKHKLYEARGNRPTPYIDRTVYVGWNALCVSAYLEAARALDLEDVRRFALRSLDRILGQAWSGKTGLRHTVAYSDRNAPAPQVGGVLDDYAFLVRSCLDAYEITSDMSYFHFAQRIADAMVERFYDQEGGGFFDSDITAPARFGALAAHRKPFQDAPTPAGNSSAAVALLRLYWLNQDERYHELAQKTLEVFAGVANQFGIFAATYGIAVLSYAQPHTSVVVVGKDEMAAGMYRAAVAPFALTKTVLHLSEHPTTTLNLPPVLAETVPNLPATKEGEGTALVCAGFTCYPPVHDADALSNLLRETSTAKPRDASAAD